ncbi:MAG: glycosyltransferase family 4 protein [Anaerolineae bacterium]|nr:glycosyltransferase family 4 protein [Anaerolineae bacterium]
MRVIYSNGARFAGGGIGNTAYHAVRGLHRHQQLYKLLCGSYRPTEIPSPQIRSLRYLSRVWRKTAVYDKSGWLDYQYRRFYDRWATQQIEPVDVYIGWSGYNLRSLQKARTLGAITILDRALAHPAYLDKLLCLESQQWKFPYRPARTNFLVQQEIASADYVFVPSPFVHHTFQSEGEDTQKLITLPFGVDTDRFQPVPQNQSTTKPFTVLFVGHISVRKGVPHLLAAWELLNWSQAELLMAGVVTLPAEIQHRYRHLNNIRYLGHVSDPAPLFQQADVFVFPSLAEGSALVTYEALACSLPVITTFNAGSVVQDGIEGFIIPTQDAQAIAEKLSCLRADDKLRQQMTMAARLRAEQFHWNTYGDRFAQSLATLVTG